MEISSLSVLLISILSKFGVLIVRTRLGRELFIPYIDKKNSSVP